MARSAILLLPLYLLSSLHPAQGYGSGAPKSQCGSLAPGHSIPAKDNNNTPYKIRLSSTQLSPGVSTEIELTHDGSDATFKGYMVQARANSDDSVIGAFEIVSDDAQYVECGAGAQSAVTHLFSEAKESIKMKWKPPSGFTGKVKIVATFVKDYSNYWVKVPSETMEVSESTSTGIQLPTEAPSAEPEPETEPESEPETESEPESEPESELGTNERHSDDFHPIYKGCGKRKSCFGIPEKCLERHKCNVVASWKPEGDKFEFQMYRKDGSRNYVGLGFSKDSKMGDELALVCANPKKAELYWNTGRTDPIFLTADAGITDFEYSAEDGVTYCKMKSPSMLKFGDHSVDLNEKQTILLAGGSLVGAGKLTFHADMLAAGEPVLLSLISSAGAKSDLLVKLHGLFMLAAWLGCAGAGMIMARYFKQTWKGKQIMGADRWFQAHRLFMVSAVILSIVAVVLIVVEVGVSPLGLEHLKRNAHPVIGLVCVLLALVQPIMAAFRPHPGDSGRNLFNWAHWGVGNMAHVFGICAIFLAGNLTKANLSSTEWWWSWVVVAYVVFHVITHLVFSLLWAKSERTQRSANQQMAEINGMTKIQDNNFGVDEVDQEGGSFRKFLFLVYFITAWILVAVLAAAVFKAV